MTTMPIQKHSRLRAIVDIEATAVVYYRGPMTSGAQVTIPRGAILVVYAEPQLLAVSCKFEDVAVERRVVGPEITNDPFYGGAAFVFFTSDIGQRFEIIPA